MTGAFPYVALKVGDSGGRGVSRLRQVVDREHARERAGVDDLVGDERSPGDHGRGRSGLRADEVAGVARHDRQAVTAEQAAQGRCDGVDERPRARLVGSRGGRYRDDVDRCLDHVGHLGHMGGDLRGGVAGDDDAVVAQQRDLWRGLAGTCRVRVTYRGDPAGQRDTRVDVVDDDRVVAEEAFRQRICVGVARQRVGGQRMQVQHEWLIDQGVEEDLDAGATATAV